MTQRTTPVHSGSAGSRGDAPRPAPPPARFGPLPDESLDALVTVLDEVRLGRSIGPSGCRGPHRAGPRDRGPADRRADRARSGRRGGRRTEHRRPAAAPAGVPVRCRPHPGRRSRRDQRRRGGDHPRWTDPRAPRRADARRGRAGRLPRPGGGAVRAAAADDRRRPRSVVGHRHRGPGSGRIPVRPADLADHARLGWLPDPRAVHAALPGARVGRQRREHPGARRVAVRRRDRARQRRRGEDRDGDRRRDHLGRPDAPGRPGQRRRRRPHPGGGRPGRGLPVREHSAAWRPWREARRSARRGWRRRATAEASG